MSTHQAFDKWIEENDYDFRDECILLKAWNEALEWVLLLGSDDDELYVKIKKELYYG